jgi:hypothetical protein
MGTTPPLLTSQALPAPVPAGDNLTFEIEGKDLSCTKNNDNSYTMNNVGEPPKSYKITLTGGINPNDDAAIKQILATTYKVITVTQAQFDAPTTLTFEKDNKGDLTDCKIGAPGGSLKSFKSQGQWDAIKTVWNTHKPTNSPPNQATVTLTQICETTQTPIPSTLSPRQDELDRLIAELESITKTPIGSPANPTPQRASEEDTEKEITAALSKADKLIATVGNNPIQPPSLDSMLLDIRIFQLELFFETSHYSITPEQTNLLNARLNSLKQLKNQTSI